MQQELSSRRVENARGEDPGHYHRLVGKITKVCQGEPLKFNLNSQPRGIVTGIIAQSDRIGSVPNIFMAGGEQGKQQDRQENAAKNSRSEKLLVLHQVHSRFIQ